MNAREYFVFSKLTNIIQHNIKNPTISLHLFSNLILNGDRIQFYELKSALYIVVNNNILPVYV